MGSLSRTLGWTIVIIAISAGASLVRQWGVQETRQPTPDDLAEYLAEYKAQHKFPIQMQDGVELHDATSLGTTLTLHYRLDVDPSPTERGQFDQFALEERGTLIQTACHTEDLEGYLLRQGFSVGIAGALYTKLRTTNAIENFNGSITTYSRNVKRWRNGTMVVRWVSAAIVEAEKTFRRVHGWRDITRLVSALAVLEAKEEAATEQVA